VASVAAAGDDTRDAYRIVIFMAVGGPDYFQYVTPARTVLAEGQSVFNYSFLIEVPAESTATVTLYTVLAGYRLYVSFFRLSTSVSCIQYFALQSDDYVFQHGDFDVKAVLPYPAEAGYALTAEQALKLAITNRDTSARTFVGAVFGTLERV